MTYAIHTGTHERRAKNDEFALKPPDSGYGKGSFIVHALAVASAGSMGSQSRFPRYACPVQKLKLLFLFHYTKPTNFHPNAYS